MNEQACLKLMVLNDDSANDVCFLVLTLMKRAILDVRSTIDTKLALDGTPKQYLTPNLQVGRARQQ